MKKTYIGSSQHPFTLSAELDGYAWQGSRDGGMLQRLG